MSEGVHVSSHEEAGEEHDHRSHVRDEHPVEPVGHLAMTATRYSRAKQSLHEIESVHDDNENKLHQLKQREERAPPALDAHDGAQVVRIHQHVYERVQQHRHAVVTRGVKMDEERNHDGDAAVVIHVQEGHLAIGLAEDKQECVDKLPVLLEVEYVVDAHNRPRIGIEEIDVAAKQGISLQEVVS